MPHKLLIGVVQKQYDDEKRTRKYHLHRLPLRYSIEQERLAIGKKEVIEVYKYHDAMSRITILLRRIQMMSKYLPVEVCINGKTFIMRLNCAIIDELLLLFRA